MYWLALNFSDMNDRVIEAQEGEIKQTGQSTIH